MRSFARALTELTHLQGADGADIAWDREALARWWDDELGCRENLDTIRYWFHLSRRRGRAAHRRREAAPRRRSGAL